MVRFTEEERVVVWDRWQAGDANRLIGRDWDGRLGRSGRLSNRLVGSVPTREDGRLGTCRSMSGRRFLGVMLGVSRCG